MFIKWNKILGVWYGPEFYFFKHDTHKRHPGIIICMYVQYTYKFYPLLKQLLIFGTCLCLYNSYLPTFHYFNGKKRVFRQEKNILKIFSYSAGKLIIYKQLSWLIFFKHILWKRYNVVILIWSKKIFKIKLGN